VGVPLLGECRGCLELLGDLGAVVALVDQAQGLVVQVQVHVALHRQELDGALASPGRPVVGGEHQVELVAPQRDRLGEVVRPCVRVAYDGSPDREHVVQRVGGVLRGAQRPVLREVEVHLRRRLGTGGQLEHDLDAVDRERLARVSDVDRGRDEGDGARRRRLAQPGADLAGGPALERCAVHVAGASQHGGAGEHVLGHGVVHEALGGDHRDLAGGDLLVADDALHAAEVVDVGVRVDHRLHRPLTAVLGVERERGSGRLGADQRVDDDDAGVTLDDAHDRQVEAPQLVDAGRDLEQAVFDEQLSLPPQARIGGVGRIGVAQELVGIEVPHHAPVRSADLPIGRSTDEAAAGIVEVLSVMHRQGRSQRVDGCPGR
jgi:hypothetical protein